MTGEFSNFCNRYYELKRLHARREERLNELLANAPFYSGETCIGDLDYIIHYYRRAQASKAKVDETLFDIMAMERNILMVLRHFGIPPGTVFTGQIPGELTYEIWADENDELTIGNINSLEPEPDDPDVIVIKCWHGDEYEEEE